MKLVRRRAAHRGSIVYFGYLGDEETGDAIVRRRLVFMDRQLCWLADLIAASDRRPAETLVPYVAPRAWDAEVRRIVEGHGFTVDGASVSADRRNRFEYPGFVALKTLASRSDPRHPIFYCHSKGIVGLDEHKMGLFRLHTHICLTADLAAFVASPSLTRACLFPYRFGWCWYNFFWIKAGYMAGLPVEESGDRYHFEALVGDRSDGEGYRGVLPLIDRLPPMARGLSVRPWYRAEETSSPELDAAYARYAGMSSPAEALTRS